MRSRLSVAVALAYRQTTVLLKNPSLFLPPMLFPLMNFTAFAGGLSQLRHVPGFDFTSGYTAFQFVFVLLQSAAFGGVFTGFGTLGLWLALRTGSGEGVQSQFPLLFFTVLISSMNLPRNLIEVAWFRDLATVNPVSYMIEALRSLVIEGWNAQALLLGFTFTFALIGISMLLATRQLKVRMTRT